MHSILTSDSTNNSQTQIDEKSMKHQQHDVSPDGVWQDFSANMPTFHLKPTAILDENIHNAKQKETSKQAVQDVHAADSLHNELSLFTNDISPIDLLHHEMFHLNSLLTHSTALDELESLSQAKLVGGMQELFALEALLLSNSEILDEMNTNYIEKSQNEYSTTSEILKDPNPITPIEIL